MTHDRNPQAEQMADESMVRCLAAQAEAIWPQEAPLLDRYELPKSPSILDIGCGTGEIEYRLAQHFPRARIVGIDVELDHLGRGRDRCAAFSDRVSFQEGDAFALAFGDNVFDLTLCRHMFQAVPRPDRVLAEMIRVTHPGGRLHVVAEDYAMMHFHPVTLETDHFWQRGPIVFAEKTGSDLRVGRKTYTMMKQAGLEDITVDYIVIDTQRVPRETFASIWTAWRDGYSRAIATNTEFTLDQIHEYWSTMLEAIRSPEGYGVWHLPVISARVPTAAARG